MAFMLNTWYCAGWSTDVTRQPLSRRYLDTPIVLYRTGAGEAVALADRCAHRFAPLSMGCLKGDQIECPYHGLRYDTQGRCVHNPHGDGVIPKAAVVRSYPLVERDGVLWIWMGEPSLADESRILGAQYTRFMTETGRFAVGTGDLVVKAHYLMVVDNLLDLTHGPFLHPDTVGGNPEDSVGAGMQVGVEEDERSITSTYFVPAMPPTPQLKTMYPLPAGDFRVSMRWEPGSNLAMQLTMTPVGQPDGTGVVLPLLHLVTPIDEHRTHYFFALARNVAIDNVEAHAGMMDVARRAFVEEDEPIIAACQAQMGTTDLFSLKPVLLQTDLATVKARRRVDRMVAAERGR